MYFSPSSDPYPNIKHLPSLLPCAIQMGTGPIQHTSLLRKEDASLWAITFESNEPIPFCKFLTDYRDSMAPSEPFRRFNEMLEYVTLPPRTESLATILRTYPIERIRRLDMPPSEEAMPTIPDDIRSAEQDRLKALIKDGVMKQVFIPCESYSKRAYLKPNGTFTFLYEGDASCHSSELLWYFKKEFDAPIPPLQPLANTDYALRHIYFHDRPGESLAVLAAIPCNTVVQAPSSNPNTILNLGNARAILDRLKAKNAELQAHFDLLTEADSIKERNKFMEASIRQLMAKLETSTA